MAQISSTPAHCPGFQEFKDLKSFMCQCNHCGFEKEIFSDEFTRPHTCAKCGQDIDFSDCAAEGAAQSPAPE